MFYMNMRAFNEGEQAEAYKKKKEEERRKSFDDQINRANHRANQNSDNNFIHHAEKEAEKEGKTIFDIDIKRLEELKNHHKNDNHNNCAHTSQKVSKEADRRYENRDKDPNSYKNLNRNNDISLSNYRNANDAANRHDRRHPKNECGIFESVKFI